MHRQSKHLPQKPNGVVLLATIALQLLPGPGPQSLVKIIRLLIYQVCAIVSNKISQCEKNKETDILLMKWKLN
jgi:hypothetical protein